MQIGLAIHGSDALLFGLAFPDLIAAIARICTFRRVATYGDLSYK